MTEQITIHVTDGEADINGHRVQPRAGQSIHESAIAEAARRYAEPTGRPVRATATHDGQRTTLLIHPDGRAEIDTPSEAPRIDPEGLSIFSPRQSTESVTDPASPPASRASFITAGRAIQPAVKGWQGVLNKAGLRLTPGLVEQAERVDVAAVARHWPGTRTVAVINAKGSASKTPTVACLSAIFARLGGAGVLAWDNNETEGTLRFRTEWAPHEATLLSLLPSAAQLLSPTAAVAEMSNYVHHQPADKYDVLWSDTALDGDHVVSAADVETLHSVASRYYRMIIMDSGNNSRAANWRAMIDHADAIVVPCTEVEDTAEVGARLLETLHQRGGHSAELAKNALVLVSQRTAKGQNMDRIVEGFRPLARSVVRIPYDPALETGVIRHDALSENTQRAWLRAAAALTGAL